MASFIQKFREAVQTDANLLRLSYCSKQAIYTIPQATVVYISDKVPIVQWLPKYHWKWMLNDIVAGLTVGVLLVSSGSLPSISGVAAHRVSSRYLRG
jgi:sodium-independent sulfate anion transporter 11